STCAEINFPSLSGIAMAYMNSMSMPANPGPTDFLIQSFCKPLLGTGTEYSSSLQPIAIVTAQSINAVLYNNSRIIILRFNILKYVVLWLLYSHVDRINFSHLPVA